jgi:hypothetical protein
MFFKELNKALIDVKLSIYHFKYYALIFEFKNPTEISQNEYDNMIDYYSNLKILEDVFK